MIEIDISTHMPWHTIPTRFITVVVGRVLKSVLPDKDYNVTATVDCKDGRKLIIEWFAVD